MSSCDAQSETDPLLEVNKHPLYDGVTAENKDDNDPKPKPVRTPGYVYMLSFLSAIGGFLFGYDTGVVAGAILPIQEKFHFTDVWKELFVSITVGAAAIFAIVGGKLNDKLGRKPTTLIASSVFICGAVLLGVAQNTPMLLIGRFIVGVGIGFASCTVPMYIAECSPPHLRGRLVSLSIVCITGGQFIASVISALFCYNKENGWRFMLGLAAVPPVIQCIGFAFMPESPRWLVEHGKDELALKVLKRIRGTSNIKDEYQAIKSACDEEAEARQTLGGQSVIKEAFTHQPVRRALIIGCLLQVFQQITGINTVMYYSATIVQMAGVSDPCQAIWLSSVTAFSNFIFTFVGIALVERIGRRALLLTSLAGVAASLAFLGVSFQVEHQFAPSIPHVSGLPTDHCSAYSSCNSCIDDSNCGFCFSPSNDHQQMNASCLLSSDKQGGIAKNCSRDDDMMWAFDYCPTPYSWMAIFGMVLYLACFAPGMGTMPWTINSEIYPLWARSFGNSLATFFNWTFNLLISMTFLSLTSAITRYGAFYLYASFAAIGFLFFFLVLPETKGVSLENMEELFSGSWIVNRKRN